MDRVKMTVDMGTLMETYRQLLQEAESLPLRVSGNSMAPFLVHDRDTVWLTAVRGPLRVGDVVLYQRPGGEYILHRICRIRGDLLWVIGDAHTVIEKGVRPEQVFARVCQVERKGKILKPGSFWWEFFAKIWTRVIPLRRGLMGLAARRKT